MNININVNIKERGMAVDFIQDAERMINEENRKQLQQAINPKPSEEEINQRIQQHLDNRKSLSTNMEEWE